MASDELTWIYCFRKNCKRLELAEGFQVFIPNLSDSVTHVIKGVLPPNIEHTSLKEYSHQTLSTRH